MTVTVQLDPGELRFGIDCSASEVGFHRFVDALHDQLETAPDPAESLDGEDESNNSSVLVTDPRFMAIALVRKIFDRVEIDRTRFALTLVKTFS